MLKTKDKREILKSEKIFKLQQYRKLTSQVKQWKQENEMTFLTWITKSRILYTAEILRNEGKTKTFLDTQKLIYIVSSRPT